MLENKLIDDETLGFYPILMYLVPGFGNLPLNAIMQYVDKQFKTKAWHINQPVLL